MKKFLPILGTLQLGDRIVVPKSKLDLVQHHAIYFGFNKNQHWFIENKEGFGVRVVTAEVFFVGVEKVTRITKFNPRINYTRNHLRDYALSKRGKSYHLWNYNCEHFANDVQHGFAKSTQAETGKGLAAIGIIALVIAGLATLGENKKSI